MAGAGHTMMLGTHPPPHNVPGSGRQCQTAHIREAPLDTRALLLLLLSEVLLLPVVDRPHSAHWPGGHAAYAARASLHSSASPQPRHWSLNGRNGPRVEEAGAADNFMFVGWRLGQVLNDIWTSIVDPLGFRMGDINDGVVFTVGSVVIAIIVMVNGVLLVVSHYRILV